MINFTYPTNRSIYRFDIIMRFTWESSLVTEDKYNRHRRWSNKFIDLPREETVKSRLDWTVTNSEQTTRRVSGRIRHSWFCDECETNLHLQCEWHPTMTTTCDLSDNGAQILDTGTTIIAALDAIVNHQQLSTHRRRNNLSLSTATFAIAKLKRTAKDCESACHFLARRYLIASCDVSLNSCVITLKYTSTFSEFANDGWKYILKC